MPLSSNGVTKVVYVTVLFPSYGQTIKYDVALVEEAYQDVIDIEVHAPVNGFAVESVKLQV